MAWTAFYKRFRFSGIWSVVVFKNFRLLILMTTKCFIQNLAFHSCCLCMLLNGVKHSRKTDSPVLPPTSLATVHHRCSRSWRTHLLKSLLPLSTRHYFGSFRIALDIKVLKLSSSSSRTVVPNRGRMRRPSARCVALCSLSIKLIFCVTDFVLQ